jgi:serine protease Do
VGDEAYASGAPLDAALSGTITKGIVSAIRRDDDGTLWIQADVDVQPGNSGGPLLDGSGNVIGITSFGLQPEGSSIGLNFFLPIEQALAVLELLPR